MHTLTTLQELRQTELKSSTARAQETILGRRPPLPVMLLLAGWSMWNLYSTRWVTAVDTSPTTVASTSPTAFASSFDSAPVVKAVEIVEPQPAVSLPQSAASRAELVSVVSELPGVVARVDVRPGDRVETGAILFRLADRARQAELKMKQAERQMAQQQLANLQTPNNQERLLAQTRVDAAEAAMRAAHDAHQRSVRVHKQLPAAVAVADLVKLEAAWKIAVANWEGAKMQLSMLDDGPSAADVAIAQAKLDQAQAAVEQVEQEIERLVVRARQAGTVVEVNVRAGEAVTSQPGQRLVVLEIDEQS